MTEIKARLRDETLPQVRYINQGVASNFHIGHDTEDTLLTVPMKRQPASLLKTAMRLTLSLALAGCHTPGAELGWAAIGQPGLLNAPPSCSPTSGHATMCRNASNAMDIAISPIKIGGQLVSLPSDQYRVQMIFRTQVPLANSAQVLVPLFHSRAFSEVRLASDQAEPRFIISLRTNSLGLDLIGAALMSPAGLAGALFDSPSGVLLETDAGFGRSDEAVGKVWISSDAAYLLVESRVEYRVLWTMSFQGNEFGNFVLAPKETRWVRLCASCRTQLQKVRYKVSPLPSVPQLSNWLPQ